ncbi:DUF6529 family protein [Smaragdicoccus niigatensis]|uniref:DUF6529 family protein n=1 Tax=Smaragdicoccus niigatensis TaxID=359359 RepID=UPI000382AA9C|nr:DUF6529 family protein [Smaragdicoccus niigatensis]
MTQANVPAKNTGATVILVPLVAGLLTSLALGVYSVAHDPQFFSVNIPGFASFGAVKSALGTVAFLLAFVQVGSALVMYGKVPITAPSWIGKLHVWSGRLAVLATVPVAVHCLHAFGMATGSSRVLIHSIAGCFLYGVFVTKMLLLLKKGVPGWCLPVFGGLVFTSLVVLWLTSSLWFFQSGKPIF